MVIYTDGSSSGTSVGPGGWAFVAIGAGGETLFECARGARSTTNNRMEMLAIMRALQWANGRECLVISDSQLCVNTLTTWADGWRARGWRKKDSSPIANLDIVKPAHDLYLASRATMQWVRGHVGVPGNERADVLCGEARMAMIKTLGAEACA